VRAGTAGAAGDLTIYAPWGNLAIFYRGFTYTDDLIRLGSLEPGAATAISELEDGPPSPSRVPTETTLGAGGKFEGVRLRWSDVCGRVLERVPRMVWLGSGRYESCMIVMT
jgi:hypothetical protein